MSPVRRSLPPEQVRLSLRRGLYQRLERHWRRGDIGPKTRTSFEGFLVFALGDWLDREVRHLRRRDRGPEGGGPDL